MLWRQILSSLFALIITLFGTFSVSAEPVDVLQRASLSDFGFNNQTFAEFPPFLDAKGSSALLLLVDGKVVFEWGDIHKQHTIHSIRKAFLNSLYGVNVERGLIDLDATLAGLGVDETLRPLSELEKSATVLHLLQSRSGIYLPAAAESAAMRRKKPVRHSHAPGAHHHYNNWDFNAAGHVF